MNIEKLIHDLRARINPQYYDQIGTESYERHQVVKALEYLREENERQRFDTLAMNQSLDLMREENERLRKDATFAALRDEVNGLTGSLDRAEKALKEAQEQPPSFWVSADGFRSRGSGRNIATKPEKRKSDDVPLYARPVPAAPAVAVPAVPDATCKQCLQVDRELREVIAGLVAIAEKKGKRQGSPNHCHQRPGIWDDDNGDLAGKPCSECAIYDRARALLQSAPQPTIGDK